MYKIPVICITNRKLVHEDFLVHLNKFNKLDVKSIILREKDLTEKDYFQLAKNVKTICSNNETQLILHTYKDVAKTLGIKAIHLSLDSLKNLTKEDHEFFNRIGTSVHSVEDAIAAEKMGATYLIAGHIYPTDCKKGLPPRGITFLKEVCDNVSIPVYSIGGITSENYVACITNGATGVCLMSSLMQTNYPDQILKNFI